jgi:DNA-binding protein Fis
VLVEADGNKGRAAELLQISYKSLLAKLKDYGLE